MAGFNLGDFYSATADIEDYLGTLKANETVREWWEDWQRQLDEQNVPRMSGFGYQSTPSVPEHWVNFFYYGMPLFGDGTDGPQNAGARDVLEQAEQVWQSGKAWASGIGGYLRDIVAPFTKYNWDMLHSTWEEFDQARVAVLGAVPANWQEFDVDGWYGGLSHQNYKLFTDALVSSMQEKAIFLSLAQALYGRTADLVVDVQTGLMDLVTTIRQGLWDQCAEWSNSSGNPQDIGPVNAKVIEAISVADDLVGYVPVVGQVYDKTKEVGESAAKVGALFNIEVEFSGPQPFKVHTSEELYTALTSALQDDFVAKWDTGLDLLAARSASVVGTIRDAGDRWMPPQIPHPRKPEWRHQFESPYVS